MSSSLFSIARTALISHQRVLETVSHNIANAETPGYSRQDAQLGASPPVRLASGMIGTGVQVQSVTRKRDTLLDDTFRAANGSNGESAMLRDTLTGVESIFGEPSDSGMSNALDRFFNAWSDLATTPTSQANRFLVQQAGAQVASLLNSYNDGLNSQRTSAVDRLSTTVVSINQLAQQVAGLNTRISASEVGGELANDLRDQRDVLLDKLSGMAGTRVISQADGSLSVLIGNSTLIDGTTARPLTLAVLVPNPPVVPPSSDLGVQVRLGDGVDALRPLGGEVKTLVDAVNTTLPGLRARLDKLASSLATQVNTLHQRGYTFVNNVGAGTAAGNFFDPGSLSAPVTAASIRLDSGVAGNAALIAAGADAAAPLDNTLATQFAQLRSKGSTVTYVSGSTTETSSFLGFFRSMVTNLGIDVSQATDEATVAGMLANQADTRRQSVSGVNTDEELIQMVRTQQAYTAATKLIKVADEMLQTIIALI
jgi:flagellar hook-associated protein 1 FlgK